LVSRCANQRRDSVSGQDFVAAHHPQLLDQLADEGFALLRGSTSQKYLEILGPLSERSLQGLQDVTLVSTVGVPLSSSMEYIARPPIDAVKAPIATGTTADPARRRIGAAGPWIGRLIQQSN
jgi:hypothetical protein